MAYEKYQQYVRIKKVWGDPRELVKVTVGKVYTFPLLKQNNGREISLNTMHNVWKEELEFLPMEIETNDE